MSIALETNQLLVIIGALGLFTLTSFFILATPKSQKVIHDRVKKLSGRYTAQGKIEQKLVAASLKKKEKDMVMNKLLVALPSISKLREKLDKTGKDIALWQYFAAMGGIFIVGTLIFKFAFGFNIILALLLGLFLGILVPHIMVSRWEGKRMKKFMLVLPDAIDLIIRGLRSGLPVTESVAVIGTEIEEPVKSVFADISQSVRIGVSFEDALMKAANKLKLNEFNFFMISVALQRETGGNLAEILENLSTTIRARAMMKLKIKAITSEARMSAYIVGALPFIVMIALSVMTPGYFKPLTDDIKGNIAAACAASSFTFGMLVMMKMAKFKI